MGILFTYARDDTPGTPYTYDLCFNLRYILCFNFIISCFIQKNTHFDLVLMDACGTRALFQ